MPPPLTGTTTEKCLDNKNGFGWWSQRRNFNTSEQQEGGIQDKSRVKNEKKMDEKWK